MKTIATIRHNDPGNDTRVELAIQDGRVWARGESEEWYETQVAGTPEAVQSAWQGKEWDLKWSD